jgi:nucleotide-binding universal stress UspA family protein
MYKRVLIPLDGSPVAEGVLPFVSQIAGPLDMEVILLRVLEPIVPVVVEGTRRVDVEDVEGRIAEAEAYLRPLAASLAARGVRTQTAVRRGSPVADQINTAAKSAGADLIAMTTHGREGLTRLVFGSVAEAVVRHAEVPVFLMRATPQPAVQGAA